MRTLWLASLLLLGCSHAQAPWPAGATPTLVRSDEEWRKTLTAEQYQILRQAGTERPGSGALLHNQDTGVYSCAGCGAQLFASDTKFDSGTGWPSFWSPIKGSVVLIADSSGGMQRVEVRCARCGGHLGHVFEDGPAPTHQRYCMNSGALQFQAAPLH